MDEGKTKPNQKKKERKQERKGKKIIKIHIGSCIH
jgi:hypothetical protein